MESQALSNDPFAPCPCSQPITVPTQAAASTTTVPNSVPDPAPAQAPAPAAPTCSANVVTIPVPIVHNEETYAYIAVKGSLHDGSCAVFGLNDAEIQAISKRFFNSVKAVVNGFMISVPPIVMLNTLAELSYKVVCSSGEGEICWTMQREI